MSQIKKLDELIVKIISEETHKHMQKVKEAADGRKKNQANTYYGAGSVPQAKTDPDFTSLDSDAKKEVEMDLKSGKKATLEEKETPKATDISGKIAEIMDSLKAMSEGSEDPKKKKIADKAAMQLEAAKNTLEALAAHEVMLQEKENEDFVKKAGKKRKTIERYLKKKVKIPEVVEKLMKKLPDEKIAEMLKKSNKELDEEKIAGAMMKVALKESYITSDVKKN